MPQEGSLLTRKARGGGADLPDKVTCVAVRPSAAACRKEAGPQRALEDAPVATASFQVGDLEPTGSDFPAVRQASHLASRGLGLRVRKRGTCTGSSRLPQLLLSRPGGRSWGHLTPGASALKAASPRTPSRLRLLGNVPLPSPQPWSDAPSLSGDTP